MPGKRKKSTSRSRSGSPKRSKRASRSPSPPAQVARRVRRAQIRQALDGRDDGSLRMLLSGHPGILSTNAGDSSLMDSFMFIKEEESKQTVKVMKMAAAAGLDLNEKCFPHIGPWFRYLNNIVEQEIHILQVPGVDDELPDDMAWVDLTLRRMMTKFDGGADVSPAAIVSALWEFMDLMGESKIARGRRPQFPLQAALQLMIREISFPSDVDHSLVDALIAEKMEKVAYYKKITSSPPQAYLKFEGRGAPAVRSVFRRWLDHYMELSNLQRDNDLRQEGEEPVSCPICTEDMLSGLILTSCGHQFHEKCIGSWLGGAGGGKCAICKKKVVLQHMLRNVPPLRNLQCAHREDDEKRRCRNDVVQWICPAFLIPISMPLCPLHLREKKLYANVGQNIQLGCIGDNCPHSRAAAETKAKFHGVRNFYGERYADYIITQYGPSRHA